MISSSLSQAFIQGLFVSGGLIIAIGAQNAFVLKQGLMKNHIFWVALTCFLCDFVLMSFGVLGFGSLISQSPMATIALAVVGALFLAVYGLRAMRSAIAGGTSLTLDNDSKQSTLLATIGTTLALTLLNPHVYLDTVVIIGGVAGTLGFEQKIAFLVGSLLVSATWFFGLGYGARLLIPLFKKAITWQILDAIIALVMWAIAISLGVYAYELYVA
ncbi:LysE/ArgO family amino acid transporter [uncultured Moraxella sp.]|uniref:LysE/ArgO family amino acid transporter n=1 Tax=uncultured Moraxella sp. TaxID=263769 RepID=UPI0025E187EC|nr:LysE/ArgO family amino acid transporter [uncultured Moraxella sp.]